MSDKNTPSKTLTAKQQRFVEEYLIDFNGTQAAIRAGYSEKTANEQASRLLANVNIQQYVNNKKNKISQKLEITAESLIKDLEYIKDISLDEDNIDKQAYLKAVELQGKMVGAFTEKVKHELTGKDGKPIVTQNVTTLDFSNLSTEQLRVLSSIMIKQNDHE